MRKLTHRCWIVVCLAFVCSACAMTQDDAEPRDPSPSAEPNADDPVARLIEALNADDNGITIDREARTVEVDAKVCLREAEFLEQLACSPDTREHESILVLLARPSMVHTAMLLLGLEPGSPIQWIEEEDSVRTVPPRGPAVGVFIVIPPEPAGDGESNDAPENEPGAEPPAPRVVPANTWVVDQNTGEVMPGNTWLFAGSKFVEVNGQEMYVADAYGTAISLVNFGDDLLARATELTDSNDSHGRVWGANTEAIPAVGTAVRVRLVLPEASDNDGEDAEAGGDGPTTPAEDG